VNNTKIAGAARPSATCASRERQWHVAASTSFHRMQSRDQVCGRRGEHERDDLVGQVVTCSLLVKTNPLLGDLIYHRSRV
jgi:hypothetical protein